MNTTSIRIVTLMTGRSNQGTNIPLTASLRRFLSEFAAFAGRKSVLATVLVALGAVLEALSLVLIIPLISVAMSSDVPAGKIAGVTLSTFRFFGIQSPFGRLALLLSIFIALVVVRAVVISSRDVAVAELQTGFVEALHLRIAQCLVAARWDQVARLRHARVTQLVSGDIQRIGTMTQLFLQFIVSCAMLLAQSVLVLLIAPSFAASTLGILLLGGVLFLPVVRRAHRLGRIMTAANLSLLDSMAQFLGGLKLAFSQNLQTRFIDEFSQSVNELTRRQLDYFREQSRVRVTLATLPALAGGLFVLLGFGVFHLATPTLIAIVLIITRMIAPASQIQQSVQEIAHILPAYQKVEQLENELAAMPQHGLQQVEHSQLPDGAIEFQSVSFRHAPEYDREAARGIEGVSLTLRPGEIVGISGPSGAGKTTFADLLVGLFSPQQGRIAVADTVLNEAMLPSWRDTVGYVSQDPFLFHDTVRRNLSWANPQSNEKEMWYALSLVGADGFIHAMERGLDTVVGERGMQLSGGERQRIALARAILRKPRLLVLDEATSAIDVDGEHKILENLHRLRPRPTIVIIAHRTESLELCERLFRFEAGHCSEEPGVGRAFYRT